MPTKAIMPGLKACRAEFSPDKPLNGVKITVSWHTATEETAITDTLTELGATVRSCSCSCNILSTQAAAASDSTSVFDQKGETRQMCWNCFKRGLDWGPGGGPDLIIDEIGNALPFIHAGVKAEEIYAKNGRLPELSSDYEAWRHICLSIIGEENCLSVIMEGLETDPKRYRNLKERLLGVCVGTTTDKFKPLMLMQTDGFLSFPVLDISDSVTESEYCKMYGSRCAILGGIKRGTNMMISGKTALVCGYDDNARKGYAMALKQGGANVFVAEADPNHATQARLRGFSVINKASDENVVSMADILVAKFNMDNMDVLSNLKNMKNNAVIYNTGLILDQNSSTHVARIEPYFSCMEQIILDCHTDKWVSSDGNKCVIVVSNPGYPNFMPSWSATSHVVAMLEFVSQKETGKYIRKVYAFPEHLEDKVSDLHLGELKAAAAKKETKGQAADLVSVVSQERANSFTTATADAMNMSKMLIMIIQLVPIIGALAFALSQVSKAELTFSAIWGGGN